MKKIKRLILTVSLALILISIPMSSAIAQTYYFSLDELIVNVYWNDDGSASIDYLFTFTNTPSASKIEYVDVGLPNSNFDINSIYADVDGKPVKEISSSDYEGDGTGVAVNLGANSIQPGQTGRVHVWIGTIRKVLYVDSTGDGYASAVFSPSWFGKQYVTGNTRMQVIFHMPPGVGPDEPRWHKAPAGFPEEPDTGFDADGRVFYSWFNPSANAYTQYKFGASFPSTYVPESTVARPTIFTYLGLSEDDLIGLGFCGCIGMFIMLTSVASGYTSKKRKMQYLPPKVAIEGHGIKRGLTAIEAAILLEQPMDKILTMILFACVKKGYATVTKRDPLTIQAVSPLPEDILAYEKRFLEAFQESDKAKRRRTLQEMMTSLVKSVSAKLKGFSRRESVAYYNDIVKRAWAQVESADTPEVKSAKYDEVMEWTMLDKNYDTRTRDVFRSGPVIVPTWWHRYDPTPRPVTTGSLPSIPSQGGGFSKPVVPGADFAASMVNGVQSFSSNVVGNLTNFTEGVTRKTNPIPVSTSSRSGGSRSGGGCACACACAGCACACAGGGR